MRTRAGYLLLPLALMLAVHYLLSRTRTGKAMRAMSDSPELARLTGIDTEAVVRATWVGGAGVAAAAGTFLAVDTHVETTMGFKMLLPTFAAAIVGGIGRPYGAMAGGLLIGGSFALAVVVRAVVGLPWLSRRGSSFIWGVWHDAKFLADQIATQRKYLAYSPSVQRETEDA